MADDQAYWIDAFKKMLPIRAEAVKMLHRSRTNTLRWDVCWYALHAIDTAMASYLNHAGGLQS